MSSFPAAVIAVVLMALFIAFFGMAPTWLRKRGERLAR